MRQGAAWTANGMYWNASACCMYWVAACMLRFAAEWGRVHLACSRTPALTAAGCLARPPSTGVDQEEGVHAPAAAGRPGRAVSSSGRTAPSLLVCGRPALPNAARGALVTGAPCNAAPLSPPCSIALLLTLSLQPTTINLNHVTTGQIAAAHRFRSSQGPTMQAAGRPCNDWIMRWGAHTQECRLVQRDVTSSRHNRAQAEVPEWGIHWQAAAASTACPLPQPACLQMQIQQCSHACRLQGTGCDAVHSL